MALAVRGLVSPEGFTLWGFPIQAVASFFGNYDFSTYLWEKIRPLDPFPREYHQRYSNVQAIIGIRGLERLDEHNTKTRNHAALLTRGLSDCRAVQTPRSSAWLEHVYYQYCVYFSQPSFAGRNAIRHGVDFETTHVDVCSSLSLFREFAADCPGALSTERALQLPVYSRLRTADIERVLRSVRKAVRNHPAIDEMPDISNTISDTVDLDVEQHARAD
jgi:hypothetical protein